MLLSPPPDDVWEEGRDETNDRVFYVHRTTAERVWDRRPCNARDVPAEDGAAASDARAGDRSAASTPSSSARVEGAATSGDAAAALSDIDGGSALADSNSAMPTGPTGVVSVPLSVPLSVPVPFSAAPPPMQCTLSAPSDAERQSLVAVFEKRRRDACPYLQPLAAVIALGVAEAEAEEAAEGVYALAVSVSFDSACHNQSVAQNLSLNGAVGEGEAARLAQCVLRALLYLHLSARTVQGDSTVSAV